MFYYIQSWMYPLFLIVLAVTTVMTTYFVSTQNGDAMKDFPFISDTANKGVSKSLFTFLFSTCNFLVFINMTIRYEQIKARYDATEHEMKHIANRVFVFIGLIACLGFNIVYSFQIDVSSTVHDVGLFLAFSMAVLYFLLHTLFSVFLTDLPGSNVVMIFARIIISVLQIGFLIAIIMVLTYHDSSGQDDRRSAAILQWSLFFSIMLYPVTFIREFARFDMRLVDPKKVRRNHGNKSMGAKNAYDNTGRIISIPGRKDSF